MFGLCISGRPVITDFQQVDATKFTVDVPSAESIHELAFFLLPGRLLPAEYAASLYVAVSPFENWMHLGGVTMESQSTICLVRWRDQIGSGSAARFGISIELKAASGTDSGTLLTSSSSFALDDAKEFARAIATDLFRYLDSYGHSAGPQAMTFLDKWFNRFSKKMERDPDFWKNIRNRD